MPFGRSRLAGQSLEYDRRRYSNINRNSRGFCDNPHPYPYPYDDQPPMPDATQQQQPQPLERPVYVTGDYHFRAVSESNTNYRGNGGYGNRGRTTRPYRGGTTRGGSYSNPYTNANANPRQFDRTLEAQSTDDDRHWQYPNANSRPYDRPGQDDYQHWQYPNANANPNPRSSDRPWRDDHQHWQYPNANTNPRSSDGPRRDDYQHWQYPNANTNPRPHDSPWRAPSTEDYPHWQYPNANANPRPFDRPWRAPSTDNYRHWQYALKQPPSQNERFIIVSYNILADYLAKNHWQQLYIHIPHHIMDWNRRKGRILLELGLWSPDIICLQEVDKFQELHEELKSRGYGGINKERTGIATDGCAIFWRTSRFELLHEESIEYSKLGLRDNVAQICVLESKHSGNAQVGVIDSENSERKIGGVNRVVVCNIHVLFNPRRGEIKLGQVRVLLEQAHAVSKAWDNAPVVIAGDFNCTPKSPLYDFLSKYELDISDLGRNVISGQQASQPNFRPNPASSDVPELARLSATILQSVVSNEVDSRNKTLKSSPILTNNTIPNVLTGTSMECQSVPDEKGSTSTGSREGQSVGSLKGENARESEVIAQHGTKLASDVSDDEERRLLQSSSSESLAMAEGPTTSATGVNESEGHLCLLSTLRHEAGKDEEGRVLITSEAMELESKPLLVLDEISGKEVERGSLALVGGSQEYLPLIDAYVENQSVLGEKEVFSGGSTKERLDFGAKDILTSKEGPAMDATDDPIKDSSEAFQADLYPKEVERANPLPVGSSGNDCQHVTTNIEETSPILGGFENAQNSLEACSSVSGKECQNGIASLGGMEEFNNFASQEQSFNEKNAQASEPVGLVDGEKTAVQDELTTALDSESVDLNRSDSLSTLGKNVVAKEEMAGFQNTDKTTETPLLTTKDVEVGQFEQGCQSTNEPQEVSSTPPFNSNFPVEVPPPPYDPYSWSPMEIEAATGNADCRFLRHDLKLKSAYTEVEDYAGTKDASGEPLVTSYHKRFMGTVDYVWHTEGLQTVKVLDTLPTHILQRTRGFPTQKWGSDHLALACQLAFTPTSATDEDPTGETSQAHFNN